ncbi:MAG: hypothetical protein ACKOX4_05175, partial [Bacteroidota bacterium]
VRRGMRQDWSWEHSGRAYHASNYFGYGDCWRGFRESWAGVGYGACSWSRYRGFPKGCMLVYQPHANLA